MHGNFASRVMVMSGSTEPGPVVKVEYQAFVSSTVLQTLPGISYVVKLTGRLLRLANGHSLFRFL